MIGVNNFCNLNFCLQRSLQSSDYGWACTILLCCSWATLADLSLYTSTIQREVSQCGSSHSQINNSNGEFYTSVLGILFLCPESALCHPQKYFAVACWVTSGCYHTAKCLNLVGCLCFQVRKIAKRSTSADYIG